MPSGLTVVIYADEGQNYLESRLQTNTDDSPLTPSIKYSRANSDNSSSIGSDYDDKSKSHRQSQYEMNYISNVNNNSDYYYQPTPPTVAGLPSTGPTFDLGTFLRFAIKCTDCLEFIHRNNVVHGEVRLSAFQWSGEDTARVKMWNFGSGTKTLETYLTSEGWRKTANNKESMDLLHNLLVYMSPEQTGRTTYIPDHRSDIYSLGIVFFVLLTGRNPFDGGPLDILNGILSRKIPLVHEIQLEVPEVLARIIEKMTNKVSRGFRYT